MLLTTDADAAHLITPSPQLYKAFLYRITRSLDPFRRVLLKVTWRKAGYQAVAFLRLGKDITCREIKSDSLCALRTTINS